ncbi:hypothetical protein HYW40_00905 [Candidatus Curtissbacteria bacterium]|nr:hypothetical protein [Candidatus Curtissbacteria bacterium]
MNAERNPGMLEDIDKTAENGERHARIAAFAALAASGGFSLGVLVLTLVVSENLIRDSVSPKDAALIGSGAGLGISMVSASLGAALYYGLKGHAELTAAKIAKLTSRR